MKVYLAEWHDIDIDSCIGIYSSLEKTKQALRENTGLEDYKTITEHLIDPKDILDDERTVVWRAQPNEVF